MNQMQMADLLNFIASTDGRNFTKQMPTAWMEIIGDLGFEDAKAAVRDHFRDSTDWLTPAHIRKRVQAMRQRRINAVGENINASRVDAVDPKESIRVQRELTRALGDGVLSADEYEAYHRSGVPWGSFAAGVIAS